MIHAIVTDHRIQRRAPADPLAPLTERQDLDASQYRGKAIPYYPSPLPKTAENTLYIAVGKGLPTLATEVARQQPARFEAYVELGQDWMAARNFANAVAAFELAVQRAPASPVALLALGDALTQAGQPQRALGVLTRAIRAAPDDPLLRYQLGITQTALGHEAEAIAAYRKATALDPDMAEAHNLLAAAPPAPAISTPPKRNSRSP